MYALLIDDDFTLGESLEDCLTTWAEGQDHHFDFGCDETPAFDRRDGLHGPAISLLDALKKRVNLGAFIDLLNSELDELIDEDECLSTDLITEERRHILSAILAVFTGDVMDACVTPSFSSYYVLDDERSEWLPHDLVLVWREDVGHPTWRFVPSYAEQEEEKTAELADAISF